MISRICWAMQSGPNVPYSSLSFPPSRGPSSQIYPGYCTGGQGTPSLHPLVLPAWSFRNLEVLIFSVVRISGDHFCVRSHVVNVTTCFGWQEATDPSNSAAWIRLWVVSHTTCDRPDRWFQDFDHIWNSGTVVSFVLFSTQVSYKLRLIWYSG